MTRASLLLVGGLIALLLLGGFLVSAPAPGTSSAPAAPVALPSHPTAAQPRTLSGGDLDVNASHPVTIAPVSGHMTYVSGGNINVAAGGTLTIINTTIAFDNYIGDNGTIANRLSHIFSLTDAGTVVLQNSTITTLVNQVNPFCSLSVRITGAFQATDSALEFPGSIVVTGSGASFWLMGSRIAANPSARTLTLNRTDTTYNNLVNASRYAPSLEVIGGAQASLLDSVENGTFALNYTSAEASGLPVSAVPVGKLLTGAGSLTVGLASPTVTPEALGLAVVYPTVQSGRIAILYNATASATSVGSSFNYNGSWTLPAIGFPASTGATVTVALPAGALSAINSSGLPTYLAALESGTAVSTTLAASSAPVTIQRISLSFVGWNYNLTVSGGGSTLNAADTTFAMNWGATPGVVSGSYYPSNSSKIVLQSGATAYLANISVNARLPSTYSNQTFVQPEDAASTANFYRWLEVPVEGAARIALEGASVQPFYAYPSGGASFNGTANALNNLATANPVLAQYASATATKRGATGYGLSNNEGNAYVLVASTVLNGLSLPDGSVLGDYHLEITAVPGNPNSIQWGYASVPAYPVDMEASGANATGPTLAGLVTYGTYKANVNAGNPTVADPLTPIVNKTIAVGQTITVIETVNNTGSAPVGLMNATMVFQQTPFASTGGSGSNATVTLGSILYGPLQPGASHDFDFIWTVDQSALLLKPAVPAGGFLGIFTAKLSWAPGNGAMQAATNVTVVPPYISFIAKSSSGDVQPSGAYVMTATLSYPTQAAALLNVTAISPGGSVLLAAARPIRAGNSTITLPLGSTVVPGVYTVDSSVYSNGRTVWSNVTSAFTVPTPASTTSTPLLDQSILGIPLWLLLVAIIAAIVAVVGVIMFARMQVKGKVVECGECGALIGEDATSCSKCGAEFEVDRVRCSRCGSTIPANSKVCPECAATLLGKEAEEKLDPERQGYADFVERYRVEGKKALGDSYSDSAFWDWWKRQTSFVPFGQWKLQQAQTSRAGMTAPKETPRTPPTPGRPPSTPTGAPRPPPGARAAAAPAAVAAPPPLPEAPAEEAPEQPTPTELITCPNCGKEVPAGYLVCTFCGAVTQ